MTYYEDPSGHDDNFMQKLITYLAVAALIAFLAWSHGKWTDDCEARGGHVVSKYIADRYVDWCYSADGRLLE